MKEIEYLPAHTETPPRILDIPQPHARSSWKGIETILDAMLTRFDVQRNVMLEFGVEFGYSAVAFSNYFKRVIGVDTFVGDIHSGVRPDFYETAIGLTMPYPNIKLVQMTWEMWAKTHQDSCYDLIHVDIVHTREATYPCGKWALEHSPIVCFHDTESFPDIKPVCSDLADESGCAFYNYPYCYGLGILVRP